MSWRDRISRIPFGLLAAILFLMVSGLLGIARGDQLYSGRDFAARQFVWIMLSIPVLLAATFVPYRKLIGFSHPLFLLSLMLLTLVFFMPARNGAHRWIPFGILYFQPSELAKLGFIAALASYLRFRRNYRSAGGLIVPFLLTIVPVLLILREPDLGTSLVFFPVLFAMLFTAGARPRHLFGIAVCGLAVLPLLWSQMSVEQKSRIVSVFSQEDGGKSPRGDGYHLHQSKQLLAFGGMWGSIVEEENDYDPLAYHLPAARTDFIFCLIGERFGYLGATVVLLAYIFLIARGFLLAAATKEPFGRLLGVGIVATIATQVIINAGMTVGLMPITGMTLPLMSYGGSSLLATSLSLGLLMNIGIRPGYELATDPFRFRREVPMLRTLR